MRSNKLGSNKYRLFQTFFWLNLVLFVGFSFLVVKGAFTRLDHSVDQIAFSSTDLFYYLSRFLAFVYIPAVAILITLLIYFLTKKNYFGAKLVLASFSGWVLTEFLFKPIFGIACPTSYNSLGISLEELFNWPWLQKLLINEPCYPSGHTASYVVFFGTLAIFSFLYVSQRWLRNLLIGAAAAVIILIGPSRIYLHVHWVSDVIAGYFLGFALLAAICFFLEKKGKLRFLVA